MQMIYSVQRSVFPQMRHLNSKLFLQLVSEYSIAPVRSRGISPFDGFEAQKFNGITQSITDGTTISEPLVLSCNEFISRLLVLHLYL